MKTQILQTIKVIVLALVLSLGVSYVFAWTGPTQAPPDGNVDTPINIGTTNQIKDGGLGLNALSVFGSGYIQTALGIGDDTPDRNLKLDVEGKVGATQYCDNNGNNCTAATDLGGSTITYTDKYRWCQTSSVHTKMIHKDDGFCFLTLVTGRFEGGAEVVDTYIGDDDYWYLGSSSMQVGVCGEARCAVIH